MNEAKMKQTQSEETINFTINAPAESAFPLFGPQREMDWDSDWRPQFVAPANGDQTSRGSVFIVRAHDRESVWVMTRYDAAQQRVEYVRVTPEHTVGQIWIALTALTASTTQVVVTYRLTALSESGSSFIEHWKKEFPQMGAVWGEVINYYLETGKPLGKPYDVMDE